MSERLRVLIVGASDEEIAALSEVALRFITPDAEVFGLEAEAVSSDAELAWGTKHLEIRRLPGDRGDPLEPGASQPLGEDGDVGTAIIEAAHRNGVEVVVVASHRQGWLRRVFAGSAAHDLLDHADFPVLAVPEAALTAATG